MAKGPRLVIVSNRVPADTGQPGGLAVALKDALEGRESLWFGWSGEKSGSSELKTRVSGSTTYCLRDLTESEHRGYYEGYSNQTLWPSFHYRLDLSQYHEGDFETYCAVNRKFAESISGIIRPDDLIWIHDYHLIPLARELRNLGVKNRIGFFLHIPFPPPEIFRAVPQREILAGGLMACDLVGFQSNRDRVNFERYICEHEGGIWMPDGRVGTMGDMVRAKSFPIGIDAESFTHTAQTEDAFDGITNLVARQAGRTLVLGVDRMDYSKGLPERMNAIEQFCERYEAYHRRTVFLQIAPVSRENVEAYAQLRDQLETLVGRVNGRFATLDWSPVHYMAQPVPRDELAALMRVCKVGLVTPLRDGMNLVAKEYVAAQNPADPGVLVLSEFAGASEQLDGALAINPHDPRQQAEAVREALEMRLEERRERHASMLATIKSCDAAWWCASFLRELGGADVIFEDSLLSAFTQGFQQPLRPDLHARNGAGAKSSLPMESLQP